jgi:hypothetical protein
MKITDLLPDRAVHKLGVIVLTDGTELSTGSSVPGPLVPGRLTGRVVLDGGWLYAEVDEQSHGEGRVDAWPASSIKLVQNLHSAD